MGFKPNWERAISQGAYTASALMSQKLRDRMMARRQEEAQRRSLANQRSMEFLRGIMTAGRQNVNRRNAFADRLTLFDMANREWDRRRGIEAKDRPPLEDLIAAKVAERQALLDAGLIKDPNAAAANEPDDIKILAQTLLNERRQQLIDKEQEAAAMRDAELLSKAIGPGDTGHYRNMTLDKFTLLPDGKTVNIDMPFRSIFDPNAGVVDETKTIDELALETGVPAGVWLRWLMERRGAAAAPDTLGASLPDTVGLAPAPVDTTSVYYKFGPRALLK